jgi:hypothetical protein
MEGERLPLVTVEMEGKKGRGRMKHKKKRLESGRRGERKLESSKEEIHNE